MRYTNAISLALAALPISTLAVSLVDFPPRLNNLPSACNAVYTSQIAGCSSTDFTSGSCSATCVASLVAMVPFIEVGCGAAGISGQNVIAAFLAGQGPSSLCSDAKAILSSSSSSSTAQSTATNVVLGPPSQNTQTSKAGNVWLTSSATTATSVSTSTSSSSSTTSASASTTSSALAASSPSAASTTAPAIIQSTTSPEQTSSQTTSAQSTPKTTTDHSGGGSPFDTSSDATALLLSIPVVLALSGLTMFAAVW